MISGAEGRQNKELTVKCAFGCRGGPEWCPQKNDGYARSSTPPKRVPARHRTAEDVPFGLGNREPGGGKVPCRRVELAAVRARCRRPSANCVTASVEAVEGIGRGGGRACGPPPASLSLHVAGPAGQLRTGQRIGMTYREIVTYSVA